ncbi:hypothetical protein [Alloactinosynnema sp. L-07]|nr:hypothetical protein [Alloactinosynnema sp. L-07]
MGSGELGRVRHCLRLVCSLASPPATRARPPQGDASGT